MYILGISAFYHDSAACIVFNDEIVVAAQEERFTRIKNDADFPEKAIGYCLQEAGITMDNISYVVFYEKPFLKFERIIETYITSAPFGFTSFIKAIPLWIKQKLFQKKAILSSLATFAESKGFNKRKLLFSEHHQAHAASAFYPSPFNEALVLCVDGVGEWATTTIWIGKKNELTLKKEIKFPHSVGLLYTAFTYYLGFKVNCDEYKVMGLAPYGEPKYANIILKELVDLKPDGSFRLNMHYFDYTSGLKMVNNRFCKLFGQPVRAKEAEITPFHMDLAASIQTVTEKIMLTMVTYFSNLYMLTNLCLAGGVALNCVINGKILTQTPIKQLWVQPAAGDAGGALGAALTATYQYIGFERKEKEGSGDDMKLSHLGPQFSSEQVASLLSKASIPFKQYQREDFIDKVAEALENGKVIGWFNGRMEYGPRALGCRSIIADCRLPEMQSHLNKKIKFRESFRPFAPAILRDKLSSFYNLDQCSPYMLLVADVNHDEKIVPKAGLHYFEQQQHAYSKLPAVTHVDYTSRIQTVGVENGLFYELIDTFYARTGCPAIINTSFNLRDEPIVCTPEDALNCFLRSDMDILAIENIIVYKEDIIVTDVPGSST
ncbi:carbamoyltransferase [Mucilaginibacter sp. SMC90]|uniref:carbamoyltransferase family protein n=1 Tax=Mucilaginibacter sp. SMC90 TaxID=2929803 RepID=UPI001FB20FAF|nr:carbamoyltransferase [Mucilaginibacter sp. SMC90]UOE46543.1 carbamoyltransferase [Mucilaginibacter sp. SMC90]